MFLKARWLIQIERNVMSFFFFFIPVLFFCVFVCSVLPLCPHTPLLRSTFTLPAFLWPHYPPRPPRDPTQSERTHHVAPSTHHSNDVARSLFSKQTGGKATQDWVLSVRRNSGLPRVYTWPFYTLEGLSLAKSIGFL